MKCTCPSVPVSTSAGTLHRVCTLSAAHGPGLRYVAFLRGCPLRCIVCVQPAWRSRCGGQMEAAALVRHAARYRPYFGQTGGLTLAGAEPLAQAEFCLEAAKAARQQGMHLCLETMGYRFDAQARALYERADLVLLHLLPALMEKPSKGLQRTLAYFAKADIPLWIRCSAGQSLDATPTGDLLRKLRIQRWETTALPHGVPVDEVDLR